MLPHGNYEETVESGFAINALVEKRVIVTCDIIDSFFVCHSIEREQSIPLL